MLVVWLVSASGALGQIITTQDDHVPWRPYQWPANSQRSGTPDTLPFSAAQPFFDDFSYPGSTPDTSKWFIQDIDFRYPRVTQGTSQNPPTVGVLELDGLRNTGLPYTTAFVSGLADRLQSHYIDLSGFSAASNIRLTFFLQPQGNGDRPESVDSFKVFFRRPTDTVKVYARGGSALTSFQQISIPLTDPGFFHGRFQIILENHGGLNGKLDSWYVDYLRLAPNRTAADTVYNDYGFGELTTAPNAPYSAFPWWLAPNLAPFQPGFVPVRNFRNQPASLNLQAEITNPGGSPFSGLTTRNLVAAIPASNSSLVGINPFTDQSFLSSGNIYFEAVLQNTGDILPANDTLRFRTPVDRVIAYDDGQADAGFGLNQDWGYGIQVNLPAPDSVEAVWICFVPTVNTQLGQPKYMEDENFRIVLWKAAHPDSTITRIAGVRVSYGDSLNSFVRYAFPSRVKVPQTFWIGVQQFNNLPLGVGFDRSFNNRPLVYYDSLGRWRNPVFPGTLMIRPELAVPAQLVSNDALAKSIFRVGPNPVPGSASFIEVTAPEALASHIDWEWHDLAGRKLGSGFSELTTSARIPLPAGMVPGLYLLKLQAGEANQFIRIQVK